MAAPITRPPVTTGVSTSGELQVLRPGADEAGRAPEPRSCWLCTYQQGFALSTLP